MLRGVLLTGEAPLYLRRDLDRSQPEAPDGVSRSPLWWPSGKLAGHYLAGFIAADDGPGDTLSDRPPRPVLRPAPRLKGPGVARDRGAASTIAV